MEVVAKSSKSFSKERNNFDIKLTFSNLYRFILIAILYVAG